MDFIIVRGDEKRVPLSNLAFGYCLGRRGGSLFIQPTGEQLVALLSTADAFFFFGHGGKSGALHLGNDEFFRQSDLEQVIANRSGRPKMAFAEVRACYSGSKAEYVNRWLELAEVVHCFPNVTASPMPPFIHPMHTYRSPIDHDPGAARFWSRLSRSPR